jgi:DNA-binding transcriptional ArsR family regulator
VSRHDRAVAGEEVLSLRFDALADGTRRRILEILRTRGQLTAGAVAAEFPEISRPAVSRHLRVLRQSGLVEVTPAGREAHYSLCADALDALWHNWFAAFASISESALHGLKRRVESGNAGRRNLKRP